MNKIMPILVALSMISACGFSGSTSVNQPDATNVMPDSAHQADAAPDAPSFITLRETETSNVVNGNSSMCVMAAGTITQAETYERLFPLSKFAIDSSFSVTSVGFVSSSTSAVGVLVQVGMYAGSVGDPTLNPSLATWLATAVVDLPNGSQQTQSIPISATIPSGAVLIVAVSSPSYASHSGTFLVEGTDGDQVLPSYYMSSSCGTSKPSTRDGRSNAPVGNFLLDVTGLKL